MSQFDGCKSHLCDILDIDPEQTEIIFKVTYVVKMEKSRWAYVSGKESDLPTSFRTWEKAVQLFIDLFRKFVCYLSKPAQSSSQQ